MCKTILLWRMMQDGKVQQPTDVILKMCLKFGVSYYRIGKNKTFGCVNANTDYAIKVYDTQSGLKFSFNHDKLE